MNSSENENLIFIRLFPNEDVNTQIKNACKNHNVKTAVVISGIGQLKKVNIGYFEKKGNYSPKIFEKPLEILSLTGNICKQNDEYFLHLHVVLGDENKKAFGGHFIEGEISITAEIVLLKNEIDILRKINKKTGLKDLHFK
jgi:predicted DNA-binding protein with PD1-like motif